MSTHLSRLWRRPRTAVALAAVETVGAARRVELSGLPAVVKVAILAEAAGAIAALARRHAARSHVDVRQVALLVTDPADAYAVLGRGRWLPTMQRPVIALPGKGSRRRVTRRTNAGQLPLFPSECESR